MGRHESIEGPKMAENNLENIFGPDSRGDTAPERARTSKRRFVRSQDQLGVFQGNQVSGRILSAWEALMAFGMDALSEAVDHGAAILVSDTNEPSSSISSRRSELGLSIEHIASASSLPVQIVRDAEDPGKRTPIRELEKIAQVLGLDERMLTWQKGAGGDSGLALRLKTLATDGARLAPSTVTALDEAAWVIATQHRLIEWLGGDLAAARWRSFEPSGNYGERGYPSWQHGIYLANQTRKNLGIGEFDAIDNMREFCERVLGIPIVQCELPNEIAGATILNGDSRGIAVNTRGSNENVWIRRATLAHEIGHVLWDPKGRLGSLCVDNYMGIERDARSVPDYIEQRANAFSVEFLAPLRAVLPVFKQHSESCVGLRAVMEKFGVSFAVARYQVWHALDRSIPLESLTVEDCTATADWTGRESFTSDFFPIQETPLNRKGLFCGVVGKAEAENLISEDTAATYLGTTILWYDEEKTAIQDFFPLA